VHLCTTIHYLMNAKMPKRVMAMGELYRWKESREVPDTLNAVLEYPEGFTVNLSSTFKNQSSSEASFMFLGTEGTVSVGWGELRYWPENVREDNRWIVESWPRRLEEQYWKDPKVQQEERRQRLARRGSGRDGRPLLAFPEFDPLAQAILAERGGGPSCGRMRAHGERERKYGPDGGVGL